MRHYSRQREAILQVLQNSKSHPTAAEVYRQVREVIPNISLGTVYRNLSELNDEGQIICVRVGDGNDHFDGDTSFHLHLYCVKCHDIIDVPVENMTKSLFKSSGFTPESAVCVVGGICKKCNKKN